MPFREKAKRLFKTRSRSDSQSQTSSNTSSGETWPDNVYKPGETMPRPKYRKPPTKEHKERLEAFSFSDAWRRKSYQSTYSPMGTRAPSRRNSLFSLASRKKSFRSPRSSRANSVTSADMEKGSVRQREGNLYGGAAMKTTRLSPEAEAEGDDDITNVGLSRIQSREAVPPSRPIPAGDHPSQSNGLPPQMTTAHDHNVFSEHELSMAMQRSHLTVPAR